MAQEQLYHEKQKFQFCLIHTLNNILQRNEFNSSKMDEICYSLNESRWFNPHKSWIGLGNYDANILMAALDKFNLKMVWYDKRISVDKINTENLTAVVFNIPSRGMVPFMKGRHWFAVIRKENIFYNLDSKITNPIKIGNIEEFIAEYLESNDTEIMLVVDKEILEENVIAK